MNWNMNIKKDLRSRWTTKLYIFHMDRTNGLAYDWHRSNRNCKRNQQCSRWGAYFRSTYYTLRSLQSSRLNKRFKFVMVLNIANDFACLVGLLYYIFLCIMKMDTCKFVVADTATCILNLFHLSMISMAGQNMTDEGIQVAYAVHRNKFIRSSTQLKSFVCEIVSFDCFSFSYKIFLHQIHQFSYRLLHQSIKLNALGFFDVDYPLIFKVISIR